MITLPNFANHTERLHFAVCCLEIRTQARHALRAWQNVQQHLGDSFVGSHAMLAAAANIAKILFPTSDKNIARRRAALMKATFGSLPAVSVVRDKKIRNHLEHFD